VSADFTLQHQEHHSVATNSGPVPCTAARVTTDRPQRRCPGYANAESHTRRHCAVWGDAEQTPISRSQVVSPLSVRPTEDDDRPEHRFQAPAGRLCRICLMRCDGPCGKVPFDALATVIRPAQLDWNGERPLLPRDQASSCTFLRRCDQTCHTPGVR
jgi:hypothetical protein